MNNFEDIQSLWQQSPVAMPDIQQAIAGIRKRRRLMQWKSTGLILLLIATILFLLWITYHYEFRFLSTKIGVGLALLAIGAATVVNSNMLGLLMKHNGADTSNHQYLQSLKKFRQRMKFMHSYGISVYFLLIGSGVLLYIYEFVFHNWLRMIVAYALTAGWFLFVWFVLRPKAIKKQTAELDGMIGKLNEIDRQLLQ